jgi:hypothetical protein
VLQQNQTFGKAENIYFSLCRKKIVAPGQNDGKKLS